MSIIVVPHGPEFYVGRVTGDPFHDASKVHEDTAFRRPVKWLTNGKPIPRSIARAALQSRLKIYGTSADATDLLPDIEECLQLAKAAKVPTLQSDLEARLVREALAEIQSGRIDSFGFENLVRDVLEGLGAQNARIVARSQDKGADILATFLVAGAFRLLVAVQAKHYQPDPPVDREVVEQLVRGIEAESANLGMIVTSGSISPEAVRAAGEYSEASGIKIELVDGPQLASLIVQRGMRGA